MAQAETKAEDRPGKGKGKAFFDRANQVVETGNWDYAIEMFLEGIKREPDNVEQGHQPLREVAMKRKLQGGKGPGLGEKLKHGRAKDPIEALVNAEFLLAKEPGSVAFMERVLKAAKALDLHDVIMWIGNILLESQRQAERPSMKVLTMLMQSFDDIGEYAAGVQACQMAMNLSPGNGDLQSAMTELSAKYTIQKGRYDQEGEFAKGVKDMDKQKELVEGDRLAQSSGFLAKQLEKARQDYQADPSIPGKINALVDALVKFEDAAYENEAIDVLTKAHRDIGAYQFKMKIGDIKMRQMTRRYRKLRDEGDKKAMGEQLKNQLAFELEEYAERAVNYPTDLSIKYELGRRQLLAGQYDEAIASLQQAQRDPKRHVAALNLLGQAFARKGWHREAAETYERALDTEMSEDRAKEVRYNLGDCLEKMGETEKAQQQFSEVAQVDYNYRDVRQRLDKLRAGDEKQG